MPEVTPAVVDGAASTGGDLRMWLVLLVAMALAPFVLTMVTSFVKLVVVGGLIRTALGTPQIPPNTVIIGLAMVLSLHIMWPVGAEIAARYEALGAAAPAVNEADAAGGDEARRAVQGGASWGVVRRAWEAVRVPMTRFLRAHSHAENIELLERLQQRLGERGGTERGQAVAHESASAESGAAPGRADGSGGAARELAVLVPAFVLSELSEAFWIGVLIFVPMLVIDLVVSNVLLALGMHMMSPTTVSLPLKLLLFVLVDGWQLIVTNVILGYA